MRKHAAMRVTVLFVMGLGVLAGARILRVFACTPPMDASYKLFDEGCGTWDWELVANGTGGPYDEGEYTIYGFCGGGYTNCSCGYVNQFEREGSKDFQYMYDEDLEEYDFWWNLTNWNNPSFSGCTSGSCQSDGEVEQDSSYIESYQGEDEEFCLE